MPQLTNGNTADECAWIVLVSKDSYLPGVLVLNHTLKKHGTKYTLYVQALDSLSPSARSVLLEAAIPVIESKAVLPEGQNASKINNMFRPRFIDAFSKLSQLNMTQFKRIVGLDADLLVLQNVDDLMTMELPDMTISCVPDCTCNFNKHEEFEKDWIPANCAYTQKQPLQLSKISHKNHRIFNSGVAVFEPSHEAWKKMRVMLDETQETDFFWGDQEFLRVFYKNHWQPLPWQYGAIKTLGISHPELWNLHEVKILHYVMDKPWERSEPEDARLARDLHQPWLDAYADCREEWQKNGLKHWDVVERLVKR